MAIRRGLRLTRVAGHLCTYFRVFSVATITKWVSARLRLCDPLFRVIPANFSAQVHASLKSSHSDAIYLGRALHHFAQLESI